MELFAEEDEVTEEEIDACDKEIDEKFKMMCGECGEEE
jgi:L-arabinose isomerase